MVVIMKDISGYMNSNNCFLGKKILLLSPAFFDFEVNIKANFENLGATVDYFDERSIQSAINRAILKISPLFFAFTTRNYYKKLMRKTIRNNYDFILIIRCDMISKSILRKLRCEFPSAKLCLYLWDPVRTIKGLEKKLDIFDCVSSFDSKDCKKYSFIKFRPFYCTQQLLQTKPVSELKYDFAFCGTVHSDRLEVLRKIELLCKKSNYTFYKYYYLPSEFMYYFYKITKKSFRFYHKDDFKFTKISSEQVNNIENSSRAVIDIQSPMQVGLTSRAINRICNQKKLVTTDEDIINYDFYNPINIFVINREDPKIDKKMLEGQFVDIDKDILKNYTFEAWAKDVLGL